MESGFLKRTQTAKIDGAVALSFAVLAATQHGRPPSMSEKDRMIRLRDQFNPITGEAIGEARVYKY